MSRFVVVSVAVFGLLGAAVVAHTSSEPLVRSRLDGSRAQTYTAQGECHVRGGWVIRPESVPLSACFPTTTTTTTTTVPPTTTTTTAPTTTTSSTTTTSTTTTTPTGDPYADIPSNFDPAAWLEDGGRIPQDMSWEPSGNFRTFCGFSHLNYDDPIVHPGRPGAAHLHMFFGNTGTDAHTTYQSLRTTGDGTCQGGPLNRTGYWTPAVINGDGNVVLPHTIELYYKGNGTRADIATIVDNPNGLRMIAGDGHPFGNLSWWSCNGNYSASIPSCAAGSTVQVELRFPMCWDGRLDSTDHRSHVTYGTGGGGWVTASGGCPATHPTHLPELTLFLRFTSDGRTGLWRLSSDGAAPAGSTFHADWFGAWDNQTQHTWTQECIREMRSCVWGELGDGSRLVNWPSVYTGTHVVPMP